MNVVWAHKRSLLSKYLAKSDGSGNLGQTLAGRWKLYNVYHFIQNLSGYIALHHRFDLKHVKQYASLGLEIERVYLYRKFTT